MPALQNVWYHTSGSGTEAGYGGTRFWDKKDEAVLEAFDQFIDAPAPGRLLLPDIA